MVLLSFENFKIICKICTLLTNSKNFQLSISEDKEFDAVSFTIFLQLASFEINYG